MIGKKAILSVVIVVAAIYLRNAKRKSPVIEINSGKLQGVISLSRDGREFYSFLNIPYAKPPIDNLRYEPPVPAGNWEEIRDASNFGPSCIQVDPFLNLVEGVEDCLQLNIFLPKRDDVESAKTLLPVIVFIHGGIFVFGSAIKYGPEHFMDENCLFVTINYRVGSFGFLNTGDGVVRGNMGLKDQTMALRWIQENIKYFGGDKNQVTLMGESAGGASTQYHTISTMSKRLFQKTIIQSGSIFNPWTLSEKPVEQALTFAKKLNCLSVSENSKLNPSVDVNCLKKLPAQEIIKANLDLNDALHGSSAFFVPSVEIDIPDGKTFFSQDPKTIMESGNYTKVPTITGVNTDEGLVWTASAYNSFKPFLENIQKAMIFRNKTALELLLTNFQKYFPRVGYLQDDVDPSIVKKIADFYFDGKPISHLTDNISELKDLTKLFGDGTFNVGFQKSSQILVNRSTKYSPVFLYYYTYQSEFTVLDYLVAIQGKYDSRLETVYSIGLKWFKEKVLGEKLPKHGICHADELLMLLPLNFPLMPTVPKDHVDYKFSKELIKLWVDFAKAKDEANELKFMGSSWPAQPSGQPLKLMKLDSKPEFIADPFIKSVDFWNSLQL